MMVNQLVGNFPALVANGPVSLPLRSLTPRHVVHSLVMKITATLTNSDGTNATGALTSTDLDTTITAIIARVRLYGGFGEPINVSTTNLRSVYLEAMRRDVDAFVSGTGAPFIGSSIAKSNATMALVAEVVIPFEDHKALNDPDWACPSTDQLAPEGFLEITAGTLGATVLGPNSATSVTATAVTVELSANLTDAHAPYFAPWQAIREMSAAQQPVQFEPGLPLAIFETRPSYGTGAYAATYVIEKDGKAIVQSLTTQTLGMAYNKHAGADGDNLIKSSTYLLTGSALPSRIGVTLFNKKGYTEEDLKPALASIVIRVPTGFSSGTYCYRILRAVTSDQEARVAQNLGIGKYRSPLRAVLGRSAGDSDFSKIALFKPRWILPA